MAAIEGPARLDPAAERVALNFLGRLSGVATLTARYVQAVEGTGARILDTRKTTPGLRALEKQAVLRGRRRVAPRRPLRRDPGEGEPRGAGGRDRRRPPGWRSLAAARRGLRGGRGGDPRRAGRGRWRPGVDRILLDNMEPGELREAVERAAGRAALEASGGITLDTVRAVAETGVDFISRGRADPLRARARPVAPAGAALSAPA